MSCPTRTTVHGRSLRSKPDCPLIACSAGFTELTGYSVQEIVGRNCRFLLNGVPSNLIDEATRVKCRAFCMSSSVGEEYTGAPDNLPDGLQKPWVELPKGEMICVQTNARKSGELFRNMFYLKQVELDESHYILGLQAGLPEEFDLDVSLGDLEKRCQVAFCKLEENMTLIEQAPANIIITGHDVTAPTLVLQGTMVRSISPVFYSAKLAYLKIEKFEEAVAMVVHVVFAAGILSTAAPWSSVLPEDAVLVPVEYRPFSRSQPEASVDFASTATLRVLSQALNLSATNVSYAVAGHSAGGAAVYQSMELLALLSTDRDRGSKEILDLAASSLPESEVAELRARLQSAPPKPLPVAAFSFEGSLMPCDVDGWAADWALSPKPLESEDWILPAMEAPSSQWTWFMARACCRSLMERCAASPPAHLHSITQFMQLAEGPRFFYVAGALSKKRNDVVFPALKHAAAATPKRLEIKEIPHAGHNMMHDQPEAVKQIFREAFELPHA
ncbi:wc-1 [Symbiodinium pilosum]|uniref:Wc-1 protein n=1 Tax=Symbiodinium pilosum TaxID=2952 RepID=A0A812QDL0_SYMPI|nr:wc-1 [Symbiodinium pilosum]